MNTSIILESEMSTVVSQYKSQATRPGVYQSEAQLEASEIEQLQRQGFEYINIHQESELISNLRTQIEKLNDISFSNNEWERFLTLITVDDVKKKIFTIQKDYIKCFTLDNGEQKNIYLLDKNDIHRNSTQVINQYVVNDGKRPTRYDVTILVNGLPLVHMELKRRGVSLKEAFNQINRYGRDSFWAGHSLFEYIQIFVISNGTETKYYSCKNKSFEMTNYWADVNNKTIYNLQDFTATFLSRHVLLNILIKYCVLTTQDELLVMRPYQIAATEKLINQIQIAHNSNYFGACGYFWHATGSGKTLTSFKASQLACQLPYIDKVFFLVDRKDLDYQTMKEYDKFQKGAANGNTSTKELKKQIETVSSKIIITTIQKMATFCKQNSYHNIYSKECIFIFDECHRSQFGAMHELITSKFKKYYSFGFTGTPIFPDNISATSQKTTADIFGKCLHSYTLVNAIIDGKVLKFKIEYVSTFKAKENISNSKAYDINCEQILIAPERIKNNVSYIIEHYTQHTRRNGASGFNAMFATQNITYAQLYYAEFKKQNQLISTNKKLKIATIFSYQVNEEVGESNIDTNGLDQSSRDFLDNAIKDYNEMFGTNYDTSAAKFPNYYKDVSMRMKNREIDLLIVVDMFLTGFDAPTLNTLYVDKYLTYHRLLQAFSRTNRVYNSIKTYGNIVLFRYLQEEIDKCLNLFGDQNSVCLIRPYKDYMDGVDDKIIGYKQKIKELQNFLDPGEYPITEKDQKKFIKLFGSILRLRNILVGFDQFEDPLLEFDRQDYTSVYESLREKYTNEREQNKLNVNDDIEFETEIIQQFDITVDYILNLISQLPNNPENITRIRKATASSSSLRNKKTLIENFIQKVSPSENISNAWIQYITEEKEKELNQLIQEENLKEIETRKFINNIFEYGFVPEGGLELNSILPPMNPFSKDRRIKLNNVIDKIKIYFNKYNI